MTAWYNENDSKTAAWLRELVVQGHLPEGTVDERSIADVEPSDVPDTAHFFAGIGGWPLALELAGWPTDRPVWTGSCPCQPFSAAGQQRGTADERHLWPEWLRLIAECRPPAILGEQVASNLGRDWLAGVRSDLEALGYAVGAADLCAASVGAPHIRQRLFWVGFANEGRCFQGDSISQCSTAISCLPSTSSERLAYARGEKRRGGTDVHLRLGRQDEAAPKHVGAASGLAHPNTPRRPQYLGKPNTRESNTQSTVRNCGGMGHTECERTWWYTRTAFESQTSCACAGNSDGNRSSYPPEFTSANGWSKYDLIPFLDGASRRVESGTFPLAHGIPARVVRLRGYGNAIVPQVAAAFVRAALEVMP
jgi:DNA (cytosine-5)-methyltransferase 1